MQNKFNRLWILAGAIVGLLSACGTSPNSDFYTLRPIADDAKSDAPARQVGLRVNRFTFPDYLDRPNIVTRQSGNRIEIAEFQRWAGALSQEFHRVLGANLGILLNTPQISVYPADTSFDPEYYLSGSIVAFDGTLDGEVRLDIYWVITDQSRRRVLDTRHSVIITKTQGKDYEALVDAYGRAMTEISEEIYRALLIQVKKAPAKG